MPQKVRPAHSHHGRVVATQQELEGLGLVDTMVFYVLLPARTDQTESCTAHEAHSVRFLAKYD